MSVIGDFDKANARAHEVRACKRCGQVKEMDQFPERLDRGRVARRHTCRSCRASYVAQRRQANRAENHRERTTVLCSVVGRMMSGGLTTVDISRLSGLSRNTVSRIINVPGGRTRFEQQTEERILDAYLEAVA